MITWGIIPVRMASSRFPGKPLALIHGVPMTGHVYHRAKMSQSLNAVYLATCDDEIKAYADHIGAPCVMTADTHQRASDRTAEAMIILEQNTGQKVDIVVMIQGDEPMIHPDMIDLALAPMLRDVGINVVNLMSELQTIEEFEDPNEVKVVVDIHDNALYFSREPIPSRKKGAINVRMLKQICVIPFRRDYLLKFNKLPPTPLEIAESVDMMRILEHGDKVKMVSTPHHSWSVDTPEDLNYVIEAMQDDSLYENYLN